MQIKLMSKKEIEKNKSILIEYIDEILITNNIKRNIEEIEETYKNMIKFTDDKSAIIIGAFNDNEELIGFIWAYKILSNEESRFHINYFIVKKEYRKNGIGKMLIKKLYEIAKKRKIKKIELAVTKHNEDAIKFYQNQNFEEERVFLCKSI